MAKHVEQESTTGRAGGDGGGLTSLDIDTGKEHHELHEDAGAIADGATPTD